MTFSHQSCAPVQGFTKSTEEHAIGPSNSRCSTLSSQDLNSAQNSRRCPPQFELGFVPSPGSDSTQNSAGLPEEGDQYWAQKAAHETEFTALGVMVSTTGHHVVSDNQHGRIGGSQAVKGLGDGLANLCIGSNPRLGPKENRYESCASPVFSMDLDDQHPPRGGKGSRKQDYGFLDTHEHEVLAPKLNPAAQEFKPALRITQSPNLDGYGHMKPTRFEPYQYREREAQHRRVTGFDEAAWNSFLDFQKLKNQQDLKFLRHSGAMALADAGHSHDQGPSGWDVPSPAGSVESSHKPIMRTINSYPLDSETSSEEKVYSWVQETCKAQPYFQNTAFGPTADAKLYPEPLRLPHREVPTLCHTQSNVDSHTQYYAPYQQHTSHQSGYSLSRELSDLDSLFMESAAGERVVVGTAPDGSFCGIPRAKLEELDRKPAPYRLGFPGT